MNELRNSHFEWFLSLQRRLSNDDNALMSFHWVFLYGSFRRHCDVDTILQKVKNKKKKKIKKKSGWAVLNELNIQMIH